MNAKRSSQILILTSSAEISKMEDERGRDKKLELFQPASTISHTRHRLLESATSDRILLAALGFDTHETGVAG